MQSGLRSGRRSYTTCVGTDLLFENEYCRAWDLYLPPGGGDAGEPHHHVLDYAFVYVAKGRLLGARAAARPAWSGNGVCFTHVAVDRLAPRRLAQPLRLGQRGWRRELVLDIPDGAGADPAFAHGGVNGYDDLPMREYLVELK